MIAGRGWAYTGTVLGGAVSIAANIAHSFVPPAHAVAGWSPEPGAIIGSVFWPIALFVAIEILARTAWPSQRRWTALRILGLLPVALVAAIVSYRHLSGLLTFYGEDALTVAIGPLAVDGLMLMATGALIATGHRRETVSTSTQVDTETVSEWTPSRRETVTAPVVEGASRNGLSTSVSTSTPQVSDSASSSRVQSDTGGDTVSAQVDTETGQRDVLSPSLSPGTPQVSGPVPLQSVPSRVQVDTGVDTAAVQVDTQGDTGTSRLDADAARDAIETAWTEGLTVRDAASRATRHPSYVARVYAQLAQHRGPQPVLGQTALHLV